MNPIVMPFLNNWDQTAQAVADARAQTLPGVDLLLIDNGSTEGVRTAARHLAAADPDRLALWLHDPPLPALAAVWNTALQYCWRLGAPHALVVNNDVRLLPETYSILLDVQARTGAWFVTGIGVTPEQFALAQDGHVVRHWAGPWTVADLARGGPDFSCFLIRQECHQWFQFDEGFVPAYHEDNDYHRRLQLAGVGDRIFGVAVPFLHYGSGTLKTNEALRESWGPKFAACQRYYAEKWGALPPHEIYAVPFNLQPEGTDPRHFQTGQGRPPWTLDTTNLFHASMEVSQP